MARSKKRSNTRGSLIARLKREGYDKSEFETEAEADAFVEGLNQAVDPYVQELEYEVLPPVAKKKGSKWTVYFKTETIEEEDDYYPGECPRCGY